jgi:inner membrane protein
MDNVCHTLVGAACGAAGLNRRTRFGAATLMISANIPDVDVLVFASGQPWIEFRRGWTHGILAQIVFPVVVTGCVWLFDRFKRARGVEGERSFHAGWTLLLAFVGVYSHVFLDYLNNYGVRLLSPINWHWFYGDAIFIVDPWMWTMMAVGIWLARDRPRPARVALIVMSCYVAVMVISGKMARGIVADTWRSTRGTEVHALMVGPLPVWPFGRQVIVDAGNHYEYGTFSWLQRSVTFVPDKIPKNGDAPEVVAARQDNNIRAFLVWSRFPFWTIEPTPSGVRVTVSDMRFAGRNGFSASTILPLVPPPSNN